jgi:hypothetical protein
MSTVIVIAITGCMGENLVLDNEWSISVETSYVHFLCEGNGLKPS